MTPFTGQIVDADGRILVARVAGRYYETDSQPSGYITVEPPFDGNESWGRGGIIRMDNGLSAEAFPVSLTGNGLAFQFANGLPK